MELEVGETGTEVTRGGFEYTLTRTDETTLAVVSVRRLQREGCTPNGYDLHWVEAINGVLSDRDSDVEIVDLNDDVWDEYIGPLCDAFEDGHFGDLRKVST